MSTEKETRQSGTHGSANSPESSEVLEASGLIGYDVHASDGSVGDVTEESVEVGLEYIVVDTGSWIFDKLRLVPAGAVERIDHETERVFLAMSKADVEDAPDFVPDSRIETNPTYRGEHEEHYSSWVSGPSVWAWAWGSRL